MTDAPALIEFAEWEAETAAAIAPVFRSRFGAVFWTDIDRPGPEHEWLIKGVLTRGERAMMVGASQTGKSFLAIHTGMCIARGEPFFGRKVRRGLVVYVAAESARGVRKRIRAYRQQHGLSDADALPFVFLTKPVDLFGNAETIPALIEECRGIAAQFDLPLELIVFDTWNAVTPGANENDGGDMSRILRRTQELVNETGASVLIVHHKNASGSKHRGHSSLYDDLENVIDVAHVEVPQEGKAPPMILRDARGRKVKRARITKQKDGEDGTEFQFVLPQVQIGVDPDGDPITSCVVEPPDLGAMQGVEPASPDRGPNLSRQAQIFRACIADALAEHAIDPPPGIAVPSSIKVVEWRHVKDLFVARWFGDEPDEAAKATAIRQAMKRHGEALMGRKIIGKAGNYVWLTGKRHRDDPEQDRGADPLGAQDAFDIPFV